MIEPALQGMAHSHLDRKEPLLRPGNTNCGGCGMSIALNMLSRGIGQRHVRMVIPACCGIVTAGPFPCSAYGAPVVAATFGSAPAFATGIARAAQMNGEDTRVICFAGDGGTYDIGLQCLSSAAERNENILYFCLDNEGYMNTGAQKSSSTPHFARTGSTPAGKTTRKKNLTEIMAAHGVPYVATASVGHLDDLRRKVAKAKAMRGLRLITLLIPCLDGWGLADDGALGAARLAVASGAFPLLEVEDGVRWTVNSAAPTRPVADYLALQRRYRNLPAADVAALQGEIDEGWARLVQRAAAGQ